MPRVTRCSSHDVRDVASREAWEAFSRSEPARAIMFHGLACDTPARSGYWVGLAYKESP